MRRARRLPEGGDDSSVDLAVWSRPAESASEASSGAVGVDESARRKRARDGDEDEEAEREASAAAAAASAEAEAVERAAASNRSID